MTFAQCLPAAAKESRPVEICTPMRCLLLIHKSCTSDERYKQLPNSSEILIRTNAILVNVGIFSLTPPLREDRANKSVLTFLRETEVALAI